MEEETYLSLTSGWRKQQPHSKYGEGLSAM